MPLVSRLQPTLYLSVDRNADQAVPGRLSVKPARLVVSRTRTAPAALAASTHAPPLAWL